MPHMAIRRLSDFLPSLSTPATPMEWMNVKCLCHVFVNFPSRLVDVFAFTVARELPTDL
jgi:hypothetical protein